MQKNTILAIVLSIMILFGYEAFFVAPKRAEAIKKAQAIASKEITNESAVQAAPPVASQDNKEKPTNIEKSGKESRLESTKAVVSYDNVGASLHSAEINGKKLPLKDIFAIEGFEDAEFFLEKESPKELVYVYSSGSNQIVKTITKKDEYTSSVRMDIKSGKSETKIKLMGIDSSRMDIIDHAEAMLYEYSIKVDGKISRKGNITKFESKHDKSGMGKVAWAAYRNHYSAFVVKPLFETKSLEIKANTEKTLSIFVAPEEEGGSYEFTVYTGPQDIVLMKKYGGDIEKVVAFFNWAFFNWIAIAFYHMIAFFQMFVKNWGVAIIIFSTIIYGATYPLTAKSMLSMRRMQEMQPKIAALRDRYKNDPQKLNTETMDMYRREKINPLGGCLPFLLQMPIFIAVYQVIWRAQYFQGQGFLWMKDLAQPDQLFILPFTLPFLGNQFNILPLLMGGLMFVQQKISAKSMVITDETQLMQQKMMTIVMPVFMAFIFYKFASSLSLYFIMFYLFSAITQYKMAKAPAKK